MKLSLIVSLLLATVVFSDTPVRAATWACSQADGGLVYQDHPGAGCRKVALAQISAGALTSVQAGAPSYKIRPVSLALPAEPQVGARSFVATTRSVPIALVQTGALLQQAQGVSQSGAGVATLIEIGVRYLPSGDGPRVTTDTQFAASAREALIDAAYVAAEGLGYNPRYLQVHASVANSADAAARFQISGASATLPWAVAIASAVLGDALRPDVCLSGTMGANLAVGPVVGLEDKIDGCHSLRSSEMIVPVGQVTPLLSSKAMNYSMQVTEAVSLADAYAAATGQFLRSVN